MRYFYAKIGQGNRLAADYLKGVGASPIRQAALPVFFGRTSIMGLKKGEAREQGKNFYDCGLEKNWSETVIVVLYAGAVHFLRPNGALEEFEQSDTETVKVLPVKLLDQKDFWAVPAILSSMSANAYFYMGTFREISTDVHIGNVLAIEASLGWQNQAPNLSRENLLKCLSSVELETLVSKICEEAGCFVPAYRGGAMKDVDVLAVNDNASPLDIAGLKIAGKSGASIQVKVNNRMKEPPDNVDYLVGLKLPESSSVYSDDWIFRCLDNYRKTRAWLKRSLSWLPEEAILSLLPQGESEIRIKGHHGNRKH